MKNLKFWLIAASIGVLIAFLSTCIGERQLQEKIDNHSEITKETLNEK